VENYVINYIKDHVLLRNVTCSGTEFVVRILKGELSGILSRPLWRSPLKLYALQNYRESEEEVWTKIM
jgi:hypothetical protein